METIDAFRRVDPRTLDDDPFWSRVRRRHPDVDVVLVPPDRSDAAPSLPSATPATPNEIGTMLSAVGELWRSVVRPLLDGAGATAPPSIRWRRRADGCSVVVQKALPGVGQEVGTDLLRALVHALHDRGWSIDPGTAAGELPALRASDGTRLLDAVAGPGATVVTLAGPSISLGTDPAATTLNELRRGVA